ncbi:MAG: aminodeoxychorismate synthase component I [Eubacteriales bacterium]
MREEIRTQRTAEEIFRLFRNESQAVFFDSALQSGQQGQFSILLFDPFLVFSSKGTCTEIIEDNRLVRNEGDPLGQLKSLLAKYAVKPSPEALPCENGCAAGFISYDFGSVLEKLPDTAIEEMDIPHLMFGFYDTAVVVDHKHGRTYVCASSREPQGDKEQETYERRKIDRICRVISLGKSLLDDSLCEDAPREFVSDFSQAEYCDMVEKAREYIHNGDIFQVNLSQRIRTRISGDAYDVYRKLRTANPAPFACYLHFGDLRVMSSSPERFFHLKDGWIETRPIKGTRPRGISALTDLVLQDELLNSEKDLAELVMIIDLERNDLGKICKMGSVEVTELVKIEAYATVFHLVSTIRGELADGLDVTDCIRATFPGGSISGVPKIRAMEIIDELEPVKRNIYTGAIGYMGFDGTSDFNIAIRTIVADKEQAFYQVGGGIVWDSDPESEYIETLNKGSAIRHALEEKGMGREKDSAPRQKNMSEKFSIQGKCVADTDFGFMYGLSLFETFPVQEDGSVKLLSAHADRIIRSAGILGFALPFGAKEWENLVTDYINAHMMYGKILRVAVSFGNAAQIKPSIHFYGRENSNSGCSERGYRMHVSKTIRNETSILSAHKTGNYAENYLAMKAAQSREYDDALFLNSRQNIAETTKCNLFFVKNDILYTPDLSCGILPGVVREFVIQRAKALGVAVDEGKFTLDDLTGAEEVFVTNSVIGIRRVSVIEESSNHIWFRDKAAGRITAMIQKEYNQNCP